jgi:hypothetical protein
MFCVLLWTDSDSNVLDLNFAWNVQRPDYVILESLLDKIVIKL